jgi:uncharacterized membrane protein YheB (UPF0754 family)
MARNPFYPGYYPGKKVPKKPVPRGPEPSHFTGFGAGDTAAKFLDGFADEVEGTLRGPDRWIRERLADDFAQSLKINALPPQGVSQEALDDYETGSIPGGGFISLNIDPREWLGIAQPGKKLFNEDGTIRRDKEAPKKMLKKTLSSWAKSAMDFNDLETMAKTDFWHEVLKGQYDPDKHTGLENITYEFVTGTKPVKGVSNPLSLSDKGVYETVTKVTEERFVTDSAGNYVRDAAGNIVKENVEVERQTIFTNSSDQAVITTKVYHPDTGIWEAPKVGTETIDPASLGQMKFFAKDVFNETGNLYEDFYRNSRSVQLRDMKYDVCLNSANHAASVEMKHAMYTGGGISTPSVSSFIDRSELTSPMGGLGKAISDANKEMRQGLVAGLNPKQLENIKGTLRTLRDEYHKVEGTYSSLGRDILTKKHGHGFVTDLDTSMGNLKSIAASKNFQIIMNAKSPAGLTTTIQDVLHDINVSSGAMTMLKGGGITGGDMFTPSLQRKALTDLGGELCSVGDLEAFVWHNNLKGTQALLTHIPRASAERGLEMANELGNYVTKGIEGPLWTRRLGRRTDTTISYFSPKHYVQKLLSRVNNFGLVLVDDDLKNKGGWNFDHKKDPGKFFGNHFSVKFNAKVNGTVTRVTMRTWGGDHYKIVNRLEELMNKAAKPGALITEQHLKELLCNNKNILNKHITKKLTPNQLVITASGWKFKDAKGRIKNIFTPEFEKLNLLAIYKTKEVSCMRIKEDLLKLQDNIGTFREHLNVKFKEMGLDPKDYDTVRNFVDQLQKMSGNNYITARYLGVMQKIGKNINKFQQFVYKIPVVGKIAKNVSAVQRMYREALRRMKEAIKKAIEKAIKQLVQKVGAEAIKMAAKLGLSTVINAITQAVAFLGDVVAPFIAHVIAWLITQIVMLIAKLFFGAIKSVFKFLKRLREGDLAEYLEEVEEKLDKSARRLMYVLIIIILILALFSPLIGFLIPSGLSLGGILTDDPFSDAVPFTLSTFSPTDPTRKWGTMQQFYDWNINLDFESQGEGEWGGPGGGGCAEEPKKYLAPISYSGATGSIINHAYEIAYGPSGLERGFWKCFNKSPMYPNAWSPEEFAKDPNPDPTYAREHILMFWCTFMIFYSEAEGVTFSANTWSCYNQMGCVQGTFPGCNPADWTVYSRPEGTIDKITPGSIIFFGYSASETVPTDRNFAHVALVHSVLGGGINTLESNNCDVSYFIPTEACGTEPCPLTPSWHQPIVAIAVLKK